MGAVVLSLKGVGATDAYFFDVGLMTVATSRFEAERMEAQEAKARRVQRLKEVRAAESRVAAQTRQAFRKAAAARTDEAAAYAERCPKRGRRSGR